MLVAGLVRHHRTLVGVAVALLCLSCGWFALALLRPGGSPVLGWLPGLVAAPMAAAACWATAAATNDRAVTRFWRQFAVAATLVGVATVLRAAHNADGGPDAGVRLLTGEMIIYLVATLIIFWALVRLPMRLPNQRTRWTFWLDVLTVMVAAALFLWHFAVRDALGDRGESRYAVATALAAMAIVLVAIFALIKVALTGTATVAPGALRALGTALAVGALGSIPETKLPAYALSTAAVTVPFTCLLAIVAAGRQRRETAAAPARETRPARAFTFMPYLAVAASTGLLLYSAATGTTADRLAVAGAVAALTGLVIGRQVLAFQENSALLVRLDAGMEELRYSERRFRSLVQNSSDLITVTDADGLLAYLSPSFERGLGLRSEERLGSPMADLVHPDDMARVWDVFLGFGRETGATVTYEARLRHADGSWRWFEITSTNLLDDPVVRGIVGNARDITGERAYRERLRHQAEHDALTGLANRTLFAERVEAAIAAGHAGRLRVLLIDINEFKAVNDTLGHAAGDVLLRAAAGRLADRVRGGDTVARLGGDEFAVLLLDVDDDDVHAVLRDLARRFADPVDLGSHRLPISASVGVAAGDPGATPDELLRRADIAMYAAKADRGGGDLRHADYHDGLDAPMLERARAEAELRAAIDAGQLRLMYQPIVPLPAGRLVAVEALVRWRHPQRGLVPPGQFVPLAEQSDLIVALGRWVLEEACAQAGRWLSAYGEAAPRVNVNVSARQLHDVAFGEHVSACLAAADLPADRLTVEITETTALHERSVDALRALRDLGVRIALDDFGTGQSSLSLLQSCPVDELKLDLSFTRTCISAGPRSVAAAVRELARALRLDLVAEGVESGAEAARLAELGYPHAQGYHFGRPAWPDALDRLMDDAASEQTSIVDVHVGSGTTRSPTVVT